MSFATMTTLAGPFTVVVDDLGAVLASGFTADADALVPLIHPTLRPAGPGGRAELGEVTRAVTAFFAGDLDAIEKVTVTQRGGEFLSAAWDVLRTVHEPVTYTEFAALSGRPAAVRAAAQACARNAAALFVPCHRVLRIGGALGGFRWGTDVKRLLLDHEARVGW